MRRWLLVITLAVAGFGVTATAADALPGWPNADIATSFGSGHFGRWITDPFGLPSYRYTIDELRSPIARQPELAGSTNAWTQVGNGHIVADAFNHGYVELWSQDRRYEWTNRYDPTGDHFAGGFGYLRVGGRTVSTLYDDAPAAASTLREFGVGYFRHAIAADGITANEYVYAPFGDDPVLLHDVAIHNDTDQRRRVTWFEYWDVNPYDQATKTQIGIGPVRWIATQRTLATTQLPTALDHDPLTIFAAALRGRVSGHVGDTEAFFGPGSRARPAAVIAGRLSGALAPGTPAEHGAGRCSGSVHRWSSRRTRPSPCDTSTGRPTPKALPRLVRRYARASAPLRTSEARWRAWLPQIAFGRAWLSRELQWDAYTVRSGATYEECRGRHIISQGGYYQYDFGFQGAFRDPLQHMLPMIYADPSLARDVLLYSAQEQPRGGQIPYAMSELCRPYKFGNSDDLDVWLLLAASEYGLATRDFKLFDTRVPFAGGGSGTLWDHLKLAFHHQQSLLGSHGGYLALDTGDWSDLSTTFLQMTESTLVDAQAAYIYPRLALLAQAQGDHAFASALRQAGRQALETTRAQRTPSGWYARGYAGDAQIGTGAIFGEPQPWAILAGAPDRRRATTLVANIRRFLTGEGAPAQLHGPERIGSAQSPAADDPAVTEHSHPSTAAIGANAAVFPGGSWYAINGWLTWALGTLGGTVPHARDYALSEFLRNTLAAHANAYPSQWDGITSVDDVCDAYYSPTPGRCGNGLSTAYAGQIMHQPAWSLFDAIRLAGITPTEAGFQIRPELPLRSFSLALPEIAVAYNASGARGYLVTASRQTLTLEVQPPAGTARWRVQADGRQVRATMHGGMLVFKLRAAPSRRASWAVTR